MHLYECIQYAKIYMCTYIRVKLQKRNTRISGVDINRREI